MPMPAAPTSADFLDPEPPHWAARGLAWLIIGLVAAALVGAFLIRVPDTVRGQFILTPEGGVNPVRARKDGIVTAIQVREGDTVASGAVLVLLRSSSLIDRSGDQRTLEAQRRADQERLRIAASQQETRLRADQAERRRLGDKIASLNRVIASKRQRLALTRELADSAQAGYRRGAVNRLEAVRLDLEATTLGEEIQIAVDELEESRADLDRLARDAEARALEYEQNRRSLLETIETARIRIDALGQDLADLTESGLALAAPCAGIVLRVHAAGAGGLVREGELVSEVACSGRRLQGEVLVPQAGLPLLKPGQPVKLRYDAFPYQRYGVQLARVRWVGPAGAAGADGTGFRALLDLDQDSISVRGQRRALQAGMRGRADVVVGRRSLVSYAVEPIRALRENLRQPEP
jgi:membrane fusion protein